ncbi:hypothetical protein [Kordia jejudonensis]|uniref:hypothetical protein n=1 Tax=Kordia jejudonensis TaxID=1348245 RepID=UPI0006293825|nr:hypothetical protein [Kordia jejudonensis]
MKKRNVTTLKLQKKLISSFASETITGGATYPCSTGPGLTSVAPYHCRVNCDSLVPNLCN